MFTGLIEDIGTVRALQRRGDDVTLRVACGLPTHELTLGESIAVNGACLTVTTILPDGFTADASTETLRLTSLGGLALGDRVHLERALAIGGRLGGHLVQGHVDGTGRLVRRAALGKAWDLHIEANPSLLGELVPKGSITVDGVSLTVNDVDERSFRVTIVPHTESNTLLIDYRVGQVVNLETDIIGKYVKRFLGGDRLGAADLLSRYGYLDAPDR